ncbi:MAG: 2OG-Fe(II) oxygenase family protein [bacterium]
MKPYDIKKLKTEGAVTIPYPADLREAVEKSIGLWKKFTALPTGVKKNLPYSNNADGVGYELKDGSGPKGDRKENFDIATGGEEWLKENLGKIESPVAREFVTHVTSLVKVMKPTILQFARDVEAEFGLEGFEKEVEESEPGFFVRFIHYFGDREVGEETATSHVDQSGFTLHLFESAPGFQCLSYDGKWIDVPISCGDQTVLINSMQMQLRSKGELKALCHRVVATPETAREGRYSAVCFVQLKGTRKYDKTKSGRLQEKNPGFNYEMPIEEFAGMFK